MGSFLSSIVGGGEASAAESSGPSRVDTFHSSQRWQLHFNSSKQTNKLMVVDFSASWCGPCKFMEPVFNGMSVKYSDVNFVKIDVDELSGLARESVADGCYSPEACLDGHGLIVPTISTV